MEIDLPRPRNQLTTKDNPTFAHLRNALYTEIREIRTRSTITTT
jgi:hypothetical protein